MEAYPYIHIIPRISIKYLGFFSGIVAKPRFTICFLTVK